jgi:cytosine/adenosine deaminase-related metal-dependent hydrolase
MLLPDSVIASSRPGRSDLRGHGVAIVGNEFRAVALHQRLRAEFPIADVVDLTGAVVMPGLINAHQHGRAISSLQLGTADDLLELYSAATGPGSMSEADARIAADHGVAFVRNAGSNLRLRSGIAPLAEYLRLGVPMALGTDNLSLGEEEDLFSELRLAGALARSPFWDAPQPPDAAALFDMATTGGARRRICSGRRYRARGQS